MMKLYQAGMSTCTQKVRFVLEEKGLPWEGIAVDLHGAENYSPEFRKINPKAIIPVLDDDGDIITESNNICVYLDEKYPQTPLMPASFKARSDVRVLLQLIDEQVHTDSSACTYAMAFAARIRKTYDTPEKLDAYLASMPDAGRRNSKREVIVNGADSKEFEVAVTRLAAMLKHIDGLLQSSAYLVGDSLTIADIAYSPYMTRLEHLKMDYMWSDKPAVAAWFARLKETKGYQKGITDFFNPDVMERMGAAGAASESAVRAILEK